MRKNSFVGTGRVTPYHRDKQRREVMHTVDHVGPGGPTGCSRIACVEKAVSEYLYRVEWPGQAVYKMLYRFCKEHDHLINPENYPFFILERHKAL